MELGVEGEHAQDAVPIGHPLETPALGGRGLHIYRHGLDLGASVGQGLGHPPGRREHGLLLGHHHPPSPRQPGRGTDAGRLPTDSVPPIGGVLPLAASFPPGHEARSDLLQVTAKRGLQPQALQLSTGQGAPESIVGARRCWWFLVDKPVRGTLKRVRRQCHAAAMERRKPRVQVDGVARGMYASQRPGERQDLVGVATQGRHEHAILVDARRTDPGKHPRGPHSTNVVAPNPASARIPSRKRTPWRTCWTQ